jgi:hypothetical protein
MTMMIEEEEGGGGGRRRKNLFLFSSHTVLGPIKSP